MKYVIVVDMQNDFITGALANPAAEAIVQPIADFLTKEKNKTILFTRDTHDFNYLATSEGKALPVEHCLKETTGWAIRDEIFKAARSNKSSFGWGFVDKPTFGYISWVKYFDELSKILCCDCTNVEEITLCGTCTDICVISNALILKALYPNAKIRVIKDLCAGLTPEKHNAAIEVMKSCQIEVI